MVYGRRRQGKSYLLRRLAEASGGLYHLATEQAEAVSLRRFAESLSGWLGLPAGGLTFTGWEGALTSAARLMAGRAEAASATGGPPLLVLDAFPYLVHETPGLPSIVQALYDEIGPGSMSTRAPLRLILCGSAISVMSGLLSGTKALRGRGSLELRVSPFGYRDARRYWGIETIDTAFVHNALVGGTPGYRELVPDPEVPDDPARLGDWVARNVLRPTVPLFDEAHRVIHEDPRIRDTAVYASLLAAVAAGESSPAKIGGLLGRPSSSLTYQLGMLESAGFVERRYDLLSDRRPTITVADPIVRLHHLVTEPHLADVEAGRARQVWDEVGHAVGSKILGPISRHSPPNGSPDMPGTRPVSRPARPARRRWPAGSTGPATRSTSWRWNAAPDPARRARPSRSSARPSPVTASLEWPGCTGSSTSATCCIPPSPPYAVGRHGTRAVDWLRNNARTSEHSRPCEEPNWVAERGSKVSVDIAISVQLRAQLCGSQAQHRSRTGFTVGGSSVGVGDTLAG
ncbi:MAG TPA: hypothetical protein VLJ59_18565 [Mycobacteriales bacterium]|nr:hypothetical protein [Mycobacteriales bacterium]